MPRPSISTLRSGAKNALRCSPADNVADAATESVDDVADGTDDVCGDVGDGLSVMGRSVGDATPKYNIVLSVRATRCHV
ncbi:unnamed protein product [Heligmosomoides polygyrus]|uniref:Uncharacterized protein n=1 Tax=Heligmosomoides polygyrus TaxID=6339 RepID=A0A183G6I9_HELPZ|nr:unnamed protein product [Heligmosomoides polygyrus]